MTKTQRETFIKLSKQKPRKGFKYVGQGTNRNPLTVILGVERDEMWGLDGVQFTHYHLGDSERMDYYLTNSKWDELFGAAAYIYDRSLEEQIAYAESVLNKPMQFKSGMKTKYTFTRYEVMTHLIGKTVSASIQKKFKATKKPFVYLAVDNYTAMLDEVELIPVPEYVEVKLNEGYTAKVYKDKMVVGCQTISPEVIDKLKEAWCKVIEQ
jgi:hypothetical protein